MNLITLGLGAASLVTLGLLGLARARPARANVAVSPLATIVTISYAGAAVSVRQGYAEANVSVEALGT